MRTIELRTSSFVGVPLERAPVTSKMAGKRYRNLLGKDTEGYGKILNKSLIVSVLGKDT